MLISKKEPYGKKNSFTHFIGYNDDDDLRSLCIKSPQMIGYAKHFNSNKTMSFKVNYNRLLKKYTKTWEKISNLMNIEFDSEPVMVIMITTYRKKKSHMVIKSIQIFKAKTHQTKMHYTNFYL